MTRKLAQAVLRAECHARILNLCECSRVVSGMGFRGMEGTYHLYVKGSLEASENAAPATKSTCRYAELIRLRISRGMAVFVEQPAILTGLPPCM